MLEHTSKSKCSKNIPKLKCFCGELHVAQLNMKYLWRQIKNLT